MGRDCAQNARKQDTSEELNKGCPEKYEVGSNKNVLDNEAEWSGDEVEGVQC